jgi:glycosyltransferase involved in cell wall biosynthesis
MSEHLASSPRISIVIPAYNEANRLPKTLARIHEYLAKLPPDCGYTISEIIVVDDGSKDQTAAIVSSYKSRLSVLRMVRNSENRGKGFSVRRGMLEATGDIGLLSDADLSTPIEEMDRLVKALDSANIAIGSRALDRSLIQIRQSRLRESAGIIFNKAVCGITGLRFKDTQCGFKAFALVPTRIVFEQQHVEGFGFDPEILFLAKHYQLRTSEVPVRWAHDPDTKVHLFRDSLKMILTLVRIRFDWLAGRYAKSDVRARALSHEAELPLLPGAGAELNEN